MNQEEAPHQSLDEPRESFSSALNHCAEYRPWFKGMHQEEAPDQPLLLLACLGPRGSAQTPDGAAGLWH